MGKSTALKAALFALALTVSGCVTVSTVPVAPDAAWFDAQLAANQYLAAATALKQWKTQSASDPQLAQMEQHYTDSTAQYRRQTVADAQSLQDQQRWAEADQRLLAAMQQLPDDEAFVVHYRHLDEVREAKRAQAQYAFDVAYAQNLPQMLNSARAIFELKPQDESAGLRVNQLQADAQQIASRLVVSAQKAESAGDSVIAERDYRLAAALSGDETLTEKAQAIAQQMAQSSQQKLRAQQRTAQANLQSQLRELDELLARNQLDEAQQMLARLRTKYGNARDLQQRQTRFDALRNQAVSAAIERGSRHYSAGELDKAIEVWERAFLLDPNNAELRDRIERAKRFRAKFESLQ